MKTLLDENLRLRFKLLRVTVPQKPQDEFVVDLFHFFARPIGLNFAAAMNGRN